MTRKQNAIARRIIGRQVRGFEERAARRPAAHEEAWNRSLHRLPRFVGAASGY